MPGKTPSYRICKGYDQAIVTLTDAAAKRRRDCWLGPQGSLESRQRYYRLLAEWETNGRRLPESTEHDARRPERTTIAEVIVALWRWAEGQCSPSEAANIRFVARLRKQVCGQAGANVYTDRHGLDVGPRVEALPESGRREPTRKGPGQGA